MPTEAPPVPVEDRHHELWHAVLASYRDAAEYNEPGTDQAGRKLERSRHVPLGDDVPPAWQTATWSTSTCSAAAPPAERAPWPAPRAGPADVTAVHPVIFGRLPVSRSPAQALDPSLHPATDLDGAVPGRPAVRMGARRDGAGRRSSSGYRGRLRVEAVTCQTTDWLTEHDPGGSPWRRSAPPSRPSSASTLPPTTSGTPTDRAAAKEDGYRVVCAAAKPTGIRVRRRTATGSPAAAAARRPVPRMAGPAGRQADADLHPRGMGPRRHRVHRPPVPRRRPRHRTRAAHLARHPGWLRAATGRWQAVRVRRSLRHHRLVRHRAAHRRGAARLLARAAPPRSDRPFGHRGARRRVRRDRSGQPRARYGRHRLDQGCPRPRRACPLPTHSHRTRGRDLPLVRRERDG